VGALLVKAEGERSWSALCTAHGVSAWKLFKVLFSRCSWELCRLGVVQTITARFVGSKIIPFNG
jgi:hypothetical protein